MNIISAPVNRLCDDYTLEKAGRYMTLSVSAFSSPGIKPFLPDFKKIQSFSKDNQVCLWMTQTRKLILEKPGFEYNRIKAHITECEDLGLNIKYIVCDYEEDKTCGDLVINRKLVQARNKIISLWPDMIWYGSGYQSKPRGSMTPYKSPYFVGYENVKNFSTWLYRPENPALHERNMVATSRLGDVIPFVTVFGGYKGNTWNYDSNRHYPQKGFNYSTNYSKKTAELLVKYGVKTFIAYSVPKFKSGVMLRYQEHLETMLNVFRKEKS